MTNSAPQILRAEEQVTKVRLIAGLAHPDARVIRCDGSLAELAAYRAGADDEPGWSLAERPNAGDLALSSVKVGQDRLVVSFCLVEEVNENGELIWQPETDVLVVPAPTLADVLEKAGIQRATFRSRSGAAKDAIVKALIHLIEHPRVVSEEEQKRTRERCSTWERSGTNRQRKLQQSDGRCECCRADLRGRFPDIGEGALEIHHRQALSKTEGTRTLTSLDDLAVLCATCHRLVHRVPNLSIDVVAARWAVSS
ncbi:HNH endonuclease [Janibacter indicus]